MGQVEAGRMSAERSIDPEVLRFGAADRVIRNALDELREALRTALMKIADDGAA
jgi:hypothetical protein